MIGVVQQVKRACVKRNRLATLIGFLLGGFVPVAIYVISHREAGALAWTAASAGPWSLIAGGLLYSAQTVYQWAKLAFQNAAKSLGFCVLIEGVMVTSHTHWLALAALCYLIVINGVATGCTLSLGRAK